MTRTLLTSDAKEALRKAIRALRPQLLEQIADATRSEYRLDVAVDKAKLPEARHRRRERLEGWLAEEARAGQGGGDASGAGSAGAGKAKGKAKPAAKKAAASAAGDAEARQRFLRDAVKEAAYTLLHRLVLLRILEHHGLSKPELVTGGWKSPAYANEFVHFAGPLAAVASGEQSAADDTRGYRDLLEAVFAEHALDLPGLFGSSGVSALLPIPSQSLRGVIDALNDAALESAWGDDTTLGWVYQYWNDPEREALDKKIADGGKIEPHEIASKTQMFTERYMVEWLLQNSLGLTWLAICRRNGWTAEAEGETQEEGKKGRGEEGERGILRGLEERRRLWRARREAGEVGLDALMPVAPGLESDWKYFVPQPIPEDAVAKAPGSIREVRLLDPACGSGHFLVIAFDLLARMVQEEARHRGLVGQAGWSDKEIAEGILANNLHGIDIDARATQIAAAALWLQAKLFAPDAEPTRMNLVAPTFRLAGLAKDDPAMVALVRELAQLDVPDELTFKLVDSLRGVGHLGSLLRVDREIARLLDEETVAHTGPLFAHGNVARRADLERALATFLDAHAAEADLGLRLGAEQIAAGLRFVKLVKEGTYDVVVGNPPYQGLSKSAGFEYVVKNYPRGKADLYAAFLERGLELVREGGISALVTMRGWMFLGQFAELRKSILADHDIRSIGDFDRGAFDEVPNEVLAVSIPVIRRGAADAFAVGLQPTPPSDKSYDRQRTNRKRAAVLAQVGRYEFDPKGFAVIEGEPIVYWWTKEFLARYAAAPKLGLAAPARMGLQTSDNTRFIRHPWELGPSAGGGRSTKWFPHVLGAAGRKWIDDVSALVRWDANGLEVKAFERDGEQASRPQNEAFYFRSGIAFTKIGNEFTARAHRVPSIFDVAGPSVFPADVPAALCAMCRTDVSTVLQALNPTVNFQAGDVARLPLWAVDDASSIWRCVDDAFAAHESHREPSVEFLHPGASPWTYAQDWAQRAVDRPEGAPLPPYEPVFDPPAPEAHVSFAIGVALGRFAASDPQQSPPPQASSPPPRLPVHPGSPSPSQGILDEAPADALPHGILFVGPGDSTADSLRSSPTCCERIATAWTEHGPAITGGASVGLRDWLRKDFFAYQKALYENRPIYFPLSSDKRTFVAWVSIHRWTDQTLSILLADHLLPVLRQLDGEIADLNTARATLDKKAAGAAEKKYGTVKRQRDELDDFIGKVRAIAERGAPPAEVGGKGRDADAPFHMDLDDGVMINSAALWPLLQPQWADPKKWWKQLCEAQGKKDYDWARLAKRYFPERVEEKCKVDPSLAVAHGCFWKYHPAKAFAWELRLQDEIRAGFTIDEDGSDAARAAWVAGNVGEVEAAREKERVRRERKAAKGVSEDEVDAARDGGGGEGVDSAEDEG